MRRALLLSGVLAVAVAMMGGAGCGATREPATQRDEGRASLAVYDSRAREVFDDNIEPAAVGLTLENPSPRGDKLLRERALTADVVARVRINTVTVDSVGDESTYHLAIQIGYPPLASPRVADRAFELTIRPTSPAYGIARAFDARLQGLTFIGFIRYFSEETGEPVIHWHLSPDTAEVAAVVREAVALGEFSAP
ncbi:hypothetical protein [Chondromyces crocatus]|uniref:Cobalamin ABC transporter substrate-binding protein n=1 Tax=Chondromyces crocatus TaxID=52 RepID=A0A0K1EBF9_CHOCO|nr:hypothetical protein [Chondromyces crocatus]AKT38017.1 cobalamin ABC transporter substrate-binding protein [Chondromyces crocatus]